MFSGVNCISFCFVLNNFLSLTAVVWLISCNLIGWMGCIDH